MLRRIIPLVAVLGLLALIIVSLAGCPAPQSATTASPTTAAPSPSGASLNLTGAGSTFVYPLYSKWFDDYNKLKGVQINYSSIGSGAGIQQLKSQTVDFGASDAPLSADETKAMPGAVVTIPTVAGPVLITWNLPGITHLKMNGQFISGVYLNKIKYWDDPVIRKLNPDLKLPHTAISVAHRADASGTSYIFTHYLAAVSPAWKTQVGAGKSVDWPVGLGGKGNEGVSGIVKQTPGCIGYIELAYALENKLPYADVENSNGEFVTPTIATTTTAANGGVQAMKTNIGAVVVNSPEKGAYPIVGFTYIMLYKDQTDPAKAKSLVDFLNWAMTAGQKEAPALLYAPLPAAVVALNQAAIKTITVNGQPVS